MPTTTTPGRNERGFVPALFVLPGDGRARTGGRGVGSAYRLLFGSSPAGAITRHQDGQVAPATPQRPDPRHAVALTTQVAAQTSDPAGHLFDRRHGCGHGWRGTGHVGTQRLPFILAQHFGTRGGWFTTRQVPQLYDSHGDPCIEDQGFFDNPPFSPHAHKGLRRTRPRGGGTSWPCGEKELTLIFREIRPDYLSIVTEPGTMGRWCRLTFSADELANSVGGCVVA